MSKYNFRKYFKVKGLSVSDDGTKIKREYENKNMFNMNSILFLSIRTDSDGNKIVRTNDCGVLRVDKLVGTCFCPPDKNGHKWYIIHIDRDKNNCHRNNLKWVTSDEYRNFYLSDLTYTDKSSGEDFIWSNSSFYVSKSGKVQIDKKDCTIEETVFDSDLGCQRAVTPFVRRYTNDNHFHVDELIANVFCKRLKDVEKQELLHIDYDMTNNESSNLKWVELDDPELQKYLEQKKKDISAINLQHSTLP